MTNIHFVANVKRKVADQKTHKLNVFNYDLKPVLYKNSKKVIF